MKWNFCEENNFCEAANSCEVACGENADCVMTSSRVGPRRQEVFANGNSFSCGAENSGHFVPIVWDSNLTTVAAAAAWHDPRENACRHGRAASLACTIIDVYYPLLV